MNVNVFLENGILLNDNLIYNIIETLFSRALCSESEDEKTIEHVMPVIYEVISDKERAKYHGKLKIGFDDQGLDVNVDLGGNVDLSYLHHTLFDHFNKRVGDIYEVYRIHSGIGYSTDDFKYRIHEIIRDLENKTESRKWKIFELTSYLNNKTNKVSIKATVDKTIKSKLRSKLKLKVLESNLGTDQSQRAVINTREMSRRFVNELNRYVDLVDSCLNRTYVDLIDTEKDSARYMSIGQRDIDGNDFTLIDMSSIQELAYTAGSYLNPNITASMPIRFSFANTTLDYLLMANYSEDIGVFLTHSSQELYSDKNTKIADRYIAAMIDTYNKYYRGNFE